MMRYTGTLRRVDDLGRIVIPKEVRRALCIRDGDPLEVCYDDTGVYFKKYSPTNSLLERVQVLLQEVTMTEEMDKVVQERARFELTKLADILKQE